MSILIVVIISLGIISLITWSIHKIIYQKTALQQTPTRDIAKVTNKYYEPNIGLHYLTNTYLFQPFTEYLVYVTYKGKEYYIDDEELYSKLDVGDKVPILIYEQVNKKPKSHIRIAIYI